MSISRNSMQELCDLIEAKPSTVLGNKFFDTRLVINIEFSHKSDKFDSRFFVISKFRVFVLVGKNANSLKIERNFHILHIKTVCVLSENELALTVDENGARRRYVIKGYPSQQLALALLKTFRHYFPDICPLLRRLVEVTPSSLYDDVAELHMDVSPRPCNSFRRSYAALCDLYDQPYRDEVAWDVEKIYSNNSIRDIRVEDFVHLLPKDLLPIVAVAEFSSYIEGVVMENHRVTAEMVDVILSVVRHSHSLKRLVLANCGLTRDFPGLLASALAENDSLPLEVIDLSKNTTLDDRKGFAQLCSSLCRLPSLSVVNVSGCALSEKSIHSLSASLYGLLSSSTSPSRITQLVLAGNVIKEDVSSIINLFSLATSLRSLDLSDTHFPLDKVWCALKFGCLQLSTLVLSGCTVATGKKSSPEATAACSAAKDFFAASVALSHIDLSRITLTPDLTKAILTGLSINHQLEPFTLLLDGSCEKVGSVLEECLPGVKASTLSLNSCGLEADFPGVIRATSRMSALRSLSVGGANVVALKKNAKNTSTIAKAVNELVKLITTSPTLCHLSLNEAHLGTHISMLINSLGAVHHLRSLDISGNDLSNFGARILAKALSLNTSLRELWLDGNHTGGDGFTDIASALHDNFTMHTIHTPTADIVEAFNRGERVKTAAAWTSIEETLKRNGEGAEYMKEAKKRSGGDRGEGAHLPLTALHVDKRVDAFIHSVEEELRVWSGDRSTVANGEGLSGSESAIISALRQAVMREVYVSAGEWACARSAGKDRSNSRTSNGHFGKHSASSSGGGVIRSETPLSECASPSPACRPRSMVTHLNDDVDSLSEVAGAAPISSNLSHMLKSRPKPQRRKIITDPQQSSVMNSSIDEESTRVSPTHSNASSTENNKHTSEQGSSPLRIAMLPRGGECGDMLCVGGEDEGVHHAPPLPLSPSTHDNQPSPPPPLPRRMAATPPILPPKPLHRDESPASSARRSVADMAKLFNR